MSSPVKGCIGHCRLVLAILLACLSTVLLLFRRKIAEMEKENEILQKEMVRLQNLILDMIDTVVVTDSTSSSPAISPMTDDREPNNNYLENTFCDHGADTREILRTSSCLDETCDNFEGFRTLFRDDDCISPIIPVNHDSICSSCASCCCSHSKSSVAEVRNYSSAGEIDSGEILKCSENLLRSSDNLVKSSENLMKTTENCCNGDVVKGGNRVLNRSESLDYDSRLQRRSDRIRKRNFIKYPK